jgi:hypothetical protein
MESISMTIYLYKKTHNITGLKYLGKTTSKDPHKYKGSGNIWVLHINKHGYNVTTEILKECQTKEELKQWGKYYSELWDIVNARDENGKKIWANLKPEEGDGGATRNGMKNKPHSLETKDKIRRANKGRTHSEESKLKNRNSNLGERNGMFNRKHTLEARQKMAISRRERIKQPGFGKVFSTEERLLISERTKAVPKRACPHCGLLCSPGNLAKWHGVRCKFKG